jgi:hypothetical protein
VAASLLPKGFTINSKEGLGINPKDHIWSGAELERKRTAYSNVELVIMDEYSMISAAMLDLIDRCFRLVARDPGCQAQPFGDFSIIMGGDFGQLAPVKGASLALWRVQVAVKLPKVPSLPRGMLVVERCGFRSLPVWLSLQLWSGNKTTLRMGLRCHTCALVPVAALTTTSSTTTF